MGVVKLTWKDIGLTVAKFAPVVGGVLGGPVGAGVGEVGSLLAKALGCDPTPDAVQAAIEKDPEAGVKIAQIEADKATRLAQIAADQAVQRLHEVVADRGSARDRQVKSGSWTPDVLTWVLVLAVAGIAAFLFNDPAMLKSVSESALGGVIIHAILRDLHEAVTFQFGGSDDDDAESGK